MIYQLPNPIDVLTPLGDGTAIFLIDYGLNVNTVWVCRMEGGVVKHFYSDDIKIYGNPMDGKGWDIKQENEYSVKFKEKVSSVKDMDRLLKINKKQNGK